MNRLVSILIAVVLSATLVSCERQAPRTTTPSDLGEGKRAGSEPPLVVSVAASATEVIEALCDEYAKQTGVEINVNSGPSSGLAAQILHGAPADLFLSANEQWADEVSEAGLVAAMHPLLTNRLVIVVPKTNPARVGRPADLLSEKVTHIALAGEKVPAGIYADKALRRLDLFDRLVDEGKIVRGQDVRSALSYVERGEAEAGIVYATDVRVAPNVESVYEFDPSLDDKIVYVLVLLKRDREVKPARKLYQFLRSAEAMKEYEEFGFSSAG